MDDNRKPGTNIFCRKIFFVFLTVVLFVVFPFFSSANAAEPYPVIAIEPMLDNIGWYMSHKAYSFQTRLTAELFTRYHCYPVARNAGLVLQQERTLASLQKKLDAMPQPDWIIGGAYQRGRKMSGNWSETDIELLLTKTADASLQREVYREKAGHYNEIRFIADKAAEKLQLRPKNAYGGPAPKRDSETWAILPFFRIMTQADFERGPAFADADMFSYLLQQSGKIGNIVSRENMQKLLQEQQLKSLGRVNIGTAAELGRLLSADKIVYAMITNGPKKGTMRFDLLLIASTNGAVVNGFSGVFSADRQAEFFSAAIRKILGTPDIIPPAGSSTGFRQSDVESKRLMTVISKSASHWRSNPVLTEQIINFAESYYLLNAKSPLKCLMLCHELLRLFDRCAPEDWELYNIRKSACENPNQMTTQEQSQAIANFLLPILDQVGHLRLIEYSASGGKLRFRLLLNAGRFEEAEEIAQKKLFGAWDISEQDMANLEMCRKNYKKGGDIFLKNGLYSQAVYAYYLAGDQETAYRSGMKQKPLFRSGSAETLLIWLELMEKYNSPAAALKWYNDYSKYTDEHTGHGYFAKARLNKHLAIKIDQLRSVVSPIKFHPVKELFSRHTDYPVYFQSLGGIPQAELQNAAKLLKENTGLTTVILPDQKLPVKGVYSEGLHAFDGNKLNMAVRYAWGDRFPSKGLLMLNITNDAISAGNTKVLYNCTGNRIGMAAFSRMPISGEKVDFSKTLAITAARIVLYNSMRTEVWCSNYPCIFVAINYFRRCNEFEFKICEECLPKAKKNNVKRALMRFRNKNWQNYCSKKEIELFETYKKEFK